MVSSLIINKVSLEKLLAEISNKSIELCNHYNHSLAYFGPLYTENTAILKVKQKSDGQAAVARFRVCCAAAG